RHRRHASGGIPGGESHVHLQRESSGWNDDQHGCFGRWFRTARRCIYRAAIRLGFTARLETQLQSRGVEGNAAGFQFVRRGRMGVLPITAIARESTQAGFPMRVDGSDVDISRNLKLGSKWKVDGEDNL